MTTHAYPECYARDARDTLAIAFDYAANDCQIPADDFAFLFIQSGIAELFEKGNPSIVAGMSGIELARAVLSFAYGSTDWPERTFTKGLSREYWAGWALAQYQWHTGRRFKDILRFAPMNEILALYPVHHEMDIERFYETMDAFLAEREGDVRLQAIRKARGLSQQQLAELSGVKLRNIQMYEQRNNDINRAGGITLWRLAQVLGCRMEDLLENPSM